MIDEQLKTTINTLFNNQKLAVLATDNKGSPHTSLVAFVVSADLKEIIFATSKQTKKYENLINEPRVSILIDTRKNDPSDFEEAVAISVQGVAEEINTNRETYLSLYLEKHPKLSKFIGSPNCALIKIKVLKYQYVSRFQKIRIQMFEP